MCIDHPGLTACNGQSDWGTGQTFQRVPKCDSFKSCIDGCFAGTVEIDQLEWPLSSQALNGVGLERLASDEQQPQAVQRGRFGTVGHEFQQAGHQLQNRDAASGQRLGNGGRIPGRFCRRNHQLCSRHQGRPELPHRRVKGWTGTEQNSVFRSKAKLRVHPLHVGRKCAVRHQYPLGATGATGGVDAVGRCHGGGQPVQKGFQVRLVSVVFVLYCLTGQVDSLLALQALRGGQG